MSDMASINESMVKLQKAEKESRKSAKNIIEETLNAKSGDTKKKRKKMKSNTELNLIFIGQNSAQ